MKLRNSSTSGLTAAAGKAAFSLQSSLFENKASVLVVLIILVLLTQSGVGLIA